MDNEYEFRNRICNSGYAPKERNWDYLLTQIRESRNRIRECENILKDQGYQGLT